MSENQTPSELLIAATPAFEKQVVKELLEDERLKNNTKNLLASSGLNRCKNCKWWDPSSRIEGGTGIRIPATCIEGETRTVEDGLCRRNAPNPAFAHSREDDWCGEFHDAALEAMAT